MTRDSEILFDEGDDVHGGIRRVLAGVAVVTLLVFAGLLYTIYEARKPPEGPLPVVRAPDGPIKVRPADPGGMDVPHTDKLVFDGLTEQRRPVEQALRALPEAPVVPPPEAAEPETPAPAADGAEPGQAGQGGPALSQATTPQSAAPRSAKTETAGAPAVEAGTDIAPQTGSETGRETDAAPDAASPAAKTVVAELDLDGVGVVLRPKPAAPARPTVATAPASAADRVPDGERPGSTDRGAGDDLVAQLDRQVAEALAGRYRTPFAAGIWQAQLTAMTDADDVKGYWEAIKADNPALFGDLRAYIMATERQGRTFYRLRTGPFATRQAARDFCAALDRAGRGCLVVEP
ncbi:sporulation related protein [Rhodothalassium salexigens DSM 2132]|uniref:Sporulation related protein n=1 Tax=Rhodothalassium salexigens DSM 2132 TaxID=1188247 RepID=A0A4R2PRQ6_RHOSA|nr:SPOR domain-containing protein [Rhodothalassium salexigens]MBB4210346.1 hypothetical protein [Rhodothalassium salexigens DSM 2132]MBK1638887.1 hypothetical protein [Rhodothalassium salexigens DSM 2132]TCP38510.1 sporulation related protein [Rhodothalassium salexigens DSM 2132]